MRMTDSMHAARRLLEAHDITIERLWLRYWGNGGNASEFDLDAHLYEVHELAPFESRILSWAVEEIVLEFMD